MCVCVCEGSEVPGCSQEAMRRDVTGMVISGEVELIAWVSDMTALVVGKQAF